MDFRRMRLRNSDVFKKFLHRTRIGDSLPGVSRQNGESIQSLGDLVNLCWKLPCASARPRGVLIVGAPRTGTTMTQNLLCTLKDTMPALPEITPFISILEAFRKSVRLDELNGGAFFGGQEAVRQHFQKFLEGIVCGMEDRYGGSLAVLKSPYLARFLPELATLLPDFVFVVLIRYPPLVVQSMRTWGDKMRRDGKSHLYNEGDYEAIAEHIREYYAPAFKVRDITIARRIRFVRYEDLLARDEKTIENLLSFIGRQGGHLNFDTPFEHSTLDYRNADNKLSYAVTDYYGSSVDRSKLDNELANVTSAEHADAVTHMQPIIKHFYHLDFAKLRGSWR